jgi:cellulose synthase operon protein B
MKNDTRRSALRLHFKLTRPTWGNLRWSGLILLSASAAVAIGVLTHSGPLVTAQSGLKNQEDQVIRDLTLPAPPPQAPTYQPAPPEPVYQSPPEPEPAYAPAEPEPAAPVEPAGDRPADAAEPSVGEGSVPENGAKENGAKEKDAKEKDAKDGSKTGEKLPTGPMSQYVLEFNRAPVVGNHLRMTGVYGESRLGFTRPTNWKVQGAKALIRYQHSPALIAERSSLTVRVNGTSVGSIPLNRKQSQIGEFWVTIAPNLIQDYNEISVVAQQNNVVPKEGSDRCSNPADPMLWTEVLPDSKLIFSYQPQAVPLDFSRFPYPFFDALGLDESRLTYVQPAGQVSESWLTATARFQAMMGRLANFRSVQSQVVKAPEQLQWNDQVIVVGTPSEQPLLKTLKLPLAISNDRLLDGKKQPLPEDAGVLMLATLNNGANPVLVATGNSPAGVEKAVQHLLQGKDRQTSTGQMVVVERVSEVSSPEPRAWPRHIPTKEQFSLNDIKGLNNQSFKDMTVRGSSAPPIEFDFKALPDERFTRGNTMDLVFSHSAQINPRTSALDVAIDGISIGGKQLTNEQGVNRQQFSITLPENLIKPDSRIQVAFRLQPKDSMRCGVNTDQQLWGTLHPETSFKLNREQSVDLPDLKLLTVGYPFAGPQDLSNTAVVVPDQPSPQDIKTLLDWSLRLGRMSQADSVRLAVHTAGSLPQEAKTQKHLVAIGLRDKFPLPELFQPEKGGFSLGKLFSRQRNQSRVLALPDQGGVIKAMISPWNNQKVLLGLSAQTEQGLASVQDVLTRDEWFFKLKDDTVLVNRNGAAAQTAANAYSLEFLQESSPKRLERTDLLAKSQRFLQENWLVLPVGIVTVSSVVFGLFQLVLNRLGGDRK